jgi:hypothetical protein
MAKSELRRREQGVAEGSEQIYNILALDKGNALKKPTKLKWKASSLEDIFDALAAQDWYPLEINGVEVVAGKRLKQGVAEMDSQGYTGSRDRKKTSKYGSRDHYDLGGPESTGRPLTAKQMMDRSHKAMLKSMSNDEKVNKGWRNPNIDEGVGNIGNSIKSLYQKIQNASDDEIEYFYNDSPIFAQYWDEYEGDLDSIIAEVNPGELQVMLDELESYVQQANLAEADYSPMAKDSMKADKIRSLKNLIAIAKKQGRQLRVQELELELKKLQGVAEAQPEPEQQQIDANRRAALRREREPAGSDAIDARLAQQHAQRQEYEKTGKFWIKRKDNQQHISDVIVGKAAANAAALDMLKQQPELRGNIVITAYGPGESQGVAEGYQLDEGAVEAITALAKKIPGIGKYYQLAQQYKPQLIDILKTSKSGKEVKQKMEQLVAQQSMPVAEAGWMKQLGGLAVGGGSILSAMWMNAMGMIDGVLARAAAGEVGGAVASGSILGLIPVTLMLFAAMLLFKGSKQSSDEKAQAFQTQRGQKGVAEGNKEEKIGGRYDADDFDDMVSRLKKLAGSGPMKTVYDPNTRRYKNVPVAQQSGDKK